MIERFNFYDVYGYLIPGAFWLALTWFPFALSRGFPSWTVAEITLLGLLGGYIAGHLLYGMARIFFPSSYEDEQGHERAASSLVLDKDNPVLSDPVKTRLAKELERRFDIDTANRAHHKDAFFLCRSALAQAKANSYIEQYQGMNSLTRGLATGAICAVAFYSGWLAAAWNELSSACATVAIILAPLVVIASLDAVAKRLKHRLDEKSRKERETAATAIAGRSSPPVDKRVVGNAGLTRGAGRRVVGKSLKIVEGVAFALVLAAIGLFAGRSYPLYGFQPLWLAVVGSILLVASRRLAIAAGSFNYSVAAAVYQDFIVLATGTVAEPTRARPSNPTSPTPS